MRKITPMIVGMNISISGMSASAARLSASASNIANARTIGALSARGPVAYQPIEVVQVSMGEGASIAGATASYRPRTPAYVGAYDPEQPFADERGMVAVPNVDLAEEVVGSLEAAATFRANLAAFKVQADTTKTLLEVLA